MEHCLGEWSSGTLSKKDFSSNNIAPLYNAHEKALKNAAAPVARNAILTDLYREAR